MDFLFRMSDVKLFSLLICIGLSFSIIGVLVAKICIPHEVRMKDNAVIGNVASLIGLVYGVLVGITSLYLINNLSSTSDAVQREANSVANIYRVVPWLKEPMRGEIGGLVEAYLKQAIFVEWPKMKEGEDLGDRGDRIVDKIGTQLRSYPIVTPTDSLVMRDLMEEEKALYDSRQERIELSGSELSNELWMVILIGTVLAISINFLFGMNLWLHLVSVCAVGLMVSSMIFLLLTLDRPFQGEFVIEPDALQAVLTTVKTNAYEIPAVKTLEPIQKAS
jgi:hypothetical protein